MYPYIRKQLTLLMYLSAIHVGRHTVASKQQ